MEYEKKITSSTKKEIIWFLVLENDIQILEWKFSHLKRTPFPHSGFDFLNHI